MAKKFGLGGGASVLFQQMDDDEKIGDSISVNIENEIQLDDEPPKSQALRKTPVNPQVQNLPAGLESDENGQLWIDVTKLQPNPYQPRVEFNQEKLEELAESIKEHGVLQAITIEDAGNGSFYIITGERRTRAAKIAGLKKIPVQLRKFSDQKKLEIALIENIQRDDLNPIEEAVAYYKLMELSGLSQEQVAQRVGKNRSTVANAIRLLKLPEQMRNALVEGTITPGHARAILSVNDSTNMNTLFEKIVTTGMNVRQAESFAAELNGASSPRKDKNPKTAVSKDPNIVELERAFIEKLGTKVQIKGTMERGSLEIQFFTKDDLNRIYDLICGQE